MISLSFSNYFRIILFDALTLWFSCHPLSFVSISVDLKLGSKSSYCRSFLDCLNQSFGNQQCAWWIFTFYHSSLPCNFALSSIGSFQLDVWCWNSCHFLTSSTLQASHFCMDFTDPLTVCFLLIALKRFYDDQDQKGKSLNTRHFFDFISIGSWSDTRSDSSFSRHWIDTFVFCWRCPRACSLESVYFRQPLVSSVDFIALLLVIGSVVLASWLHFSFMVMRNPDQTCTVV